MKELIHNFFVIACAASISAAIFTVIGWKWFRNAFYLLAVLLLVASAVARMLYNWPLMCLYQEPYLISMILLALPIYLQARGYARAAIAVGTAGVLISFYTILFPGDIYVSFVKTNSIFAHLFSFFSSFARAAYFGAGAIAVYIFLFEHASIHNASANARIIRNLIIAGFSFHTVGMFCGGIWAYCGWGIPIQWQSHILLGMAGVWFYYACYLHLHLAGNFGRKFMLATAFTGGILTLVFAFLPDTGAFSFQGIL